MKLSNRSIRKSDSLFYSLSVFLNLDIQRGVFVLYLLQIGITQSEIGILQSILFFSCMLLEVPSGLMADKYGRKITIIFGFVGLALSGCGFILFSTFLPFAILFFLFGASIAMGSGSDRALLYDNLLSEGREKEYPRILSTARAVGAIALGISMFIGGVIQDTWSWNGVYLMFAASKFIGAIVVVFIPEMRISAEGVLSEDGKSVSIKHSGGVLHSLVSFFRSKRGGYLIPLFIGYALFELSTIPLFIYGQPFFLEKGLSIPFIAGVYASIEVVSALMFMMASGICSRYSLGVIGAITTVIATMLLYVLSLDIGMILSIVVFLLIMSLPSIYEVSYENFIHENVDSHIRASCLSLANLFNSVIIGISYIAFGSLLDKYGFSVTLLIVAAVCVSSVAGLVITLLNNEKIVVTRLQKSSEK